MCRGVLRFSLIILVMFRSVCGLTHVYTNATLLPAVGTEECINFHTSPRGILFFFWVKIYYS